MLGSSVNSIARKNGGENALKIMYLTCQIEKKYFNCNNINYNAHHISNLESILLPRKDFLVGRACNKRIKYGELPQ